MDQTNPTQLEHELRLRQAVAAIERYKAAVQTRRQQDAKILAAVVRSLSEPRGLMRDDAESFKDLVRSIVKEEIGGAA